ncbi:hypothetical protein CC1G_00048 [Coprinopsis cinerea okayama7|uniref:Cyclin N-terminal domain-containing protein n=1 Tax=Coprinopsis cinerea (strain Okayama-7 / 130 / ATCC MYA-4618 / FGSC 9003) TaxID=240176 RepID=A8NWK0_COPC7|nr:hypothetical protein CC1G_00048 [Coprinopsis cinerea okayama7\|eukprot:XP_001836912.1 hypothetical protein CC1G_00048 [Coprinopsis cinerea okayama7\
MPVPVPRVAKSTANPVMKRTRDVGATPSWKVSKPRRIWEEDSYLPDQRREQDFIHGLAFAGNAMAIKGARAQACLPPLTAAAALRVYPQAGVHSRQGYARDVECWEGEEEYPAPCDGCDAMEIEEDVETDDVSPDLVFSNLATYEDQPHRHSSYKPIYHDHSPGTDSGHESGSSPLEPITPFADFVDGVVAAEQPSLTGEDCITAPVNANYGVLKQDSSAESRLAPVFPTLAEPVKEPAPAPEVITPSPTSGYRQLSQPLSEWLASYVWKVCTTGLSLSPAFTYPSTRAVQYPLAPPRYLAPAIHSLLLSTLLQPSAVFLGLWYIIRLPVFFNAELGPEYPKEARFRHALLGDAYSYEREGLEVNAPFRLVVLGCMLANKWLDDHTFTNKTWHTISNVPIQELNRLEAMALDVFSYDLSISNKEWAHWMTHLQSYHMSLAPSHLQPIGRPSSNPHSTIRKTIDEIVQAPSPSSFSPLPQPVFLGLEERKEKLDKQYASSASIMEINLDEDGPLREEYLPRRRVIDPAALRDTQLQLSGQENLHAVNAAATKTLPPPAKWSPSGDEPILRDRNRSSGHYVAVQPSQPHLYSMGYRPHGLPSCDASFGIAYKAYPTYAYAPAVFVSHPYTIYPHATTTAMTHSRSQSLFYDSDNLLSRHHLRSYSQSGYDYKCSDVRMTSQEHLATFKTEPRWIEANPYMYPAAGYAA